jgi:error-prone DNA polymerase
MHPKVRHALTEELRLIGELKYAPFFLTVHDIVQFARRQGILCQGRGSAANSVICYCLGITEVDPATTDLLFERFVSAERREPPDIDVDFEHERREEVIQYIYRTYTRERAGLAATVICYRGRSAIRDVGKVFGLSEDTLNRLAGTMWGWSMKGVTDADAKRAGFVLNDRRFSQVLSLARELLGFPRHLSQHVGGFVITRSRLDEVVPIENAAMEDRTVIEWEKNDLESLGLLKVDVLALGMLSCLRRGFAMLQETYGELRALSDQDEDEQTYKMIQHADTIGVFQIESRAQMSMLPRLKPKEFYDLVIEVAIVRPGPIQGNMVHPYLRRRQNPKLVNYPSPELESILWKTLGVPLFQEQAMRIAIVGAGFPPGEADRLRRAMATF